MKTLLIPAFFALSSCAALAGELVFTNADGSALSEVCVTAVNSPEKMYQVAKKLAVTQLNTVACNGMPLEKFVAKYGYKPEEHESPMITSFVFNKSNDDPETELCFAAVTDDVRIQEVKEKHFPGEMDVEETVLCNGLPLKQFVKKYARQRQLATSVR
ncbi:MAG: hypothetical protein RQ826_09750 [Xanthomonadales bacterium]|nr:hypothetical protein [Xanthomonadales bacterium]